MDWKSFVELTTAIGSIATAITVWFLLQQRKDSIKPHILISHSDKVYKIIKIAFFYKIEGPGNKFPYFSLINAGNGLAVDIYVKIIKA